MWPLQQKFPWIIDTNIKNVATKTDVSMDQQHKQRMRPLQQNFPWISDTNIKNVATTTEVSMDYRHKHKECGHYNRNFH